MFLTSWPSLQALESFNSHCILLKEVLLSLHFTDEEMEAQRG